MDIWSALEKFGIPVATGASGFVGAALNFKKRIEDLEKDFTKHKEAVAKEFADLKKTWKDETDESEKTNLAQYVSLQKQVHELKERFEQYQRGSIADFANAEEMRDFIEEQGRQWQAVQRTLGQIEGWLERNPPPAPPSPYLPPRSLPTRTKR